MESVNRFAAIFVIRDQSAPYGWMVIIRSDQGMAIERSDSDSILMIMRLLSAGFADSSRKGKTYNGCIFGSGRCAAPHCEDS